MALTTIAIAGLGVLFGKLQQGIVENQQILQLAQMRADAEELYGSKLAAIPAATDRTGGFSRDDGATAKQVRLEPCLVFSATLFLFFIFILAAFHYSLLLLTIHTGLRGLAHRDGGGLLLPPAAQHSEACCGRMLKKQAGKAHRKVSENIRALVLDPFSTWCEDHADRVNHSHDELLVLIKAHDKQHEVVKKLRSHYFNKCRLVDDMEEETKFIAVPPVDSPSSASPAALTPVIKLVSDKDRDAEINDDDYEPLEIGDDFMQPTHIKQKLADMLEEIPLGEVKVAILGTYQNVATGDVLVQWIVKNWGASSVSYAERIGQDLVLNGFLRLVGAVGNTFSNNIKMHYQFRPKAFQWAGVSPKPSNSLLRRQTTIQINGDGPDSPAGAANSPTIGIIGGLFSNQHPGETSNDRIRREAKEADARYKTAVRQMDLLRCQLEEAVMEHLRFMEKCETDRVKAIKSVILDFSGAVSNIVPSLQKAMDQIEMLQESVLPATDLRYLIENYRTGSYVPKVITYESYYNSPDGELSCLVLSSGWD